MPAADSVHKVAVLLSCLGASDRANLLDRLPPELADAARIEMARLPDEGDGESTAVMRAFIQQAAQYWSQRHQHVRHRIDQGQLGRFHFLSRLPPDEVARMIQDELPQTQAVILAGCDQTFAGHVSARLPVATRGQIVQRLATTAAAPVVDDVALVLQRSVARRNDVA